ncbi:MAG: type III pantothenate kinase [Bacteroidales bacterium]|nr:type III pantothenate kinase [Bacteroidales bacterium]
MFLVIDIGNTLRKAAVFDEDGLVVAQCHWECVDDLLHVVAPYEIQACIVSTVREEGSQLVAALNRYFQTLLFSASLPLPITLCYDTPRTLGTDRIACAVGAHSLFPDRTVLAIQAGTCLVADLVTAKGEYLGGSIAPGLHMRFTALAEGTARLPLVEPRPDAEVLGKSTEASILSGVIHGIHFEIDGMIEHYGEQFPDLQTVLTGGDATLLKNSIKNPIFAAPNLVLFGLYRILKFNASDC